MTPERGRELLQEASVVIFPRWDISSTIVFDNFVTNKDKRMKLSPKVVDIIYIRSGFNPDNTTLLIWLLILWRVSI